MAISINRYDVLWGYTASALNIGAGLILLPVILHYLSPEDVGLWFVFMTLANLAQLLELGFNPTLARNVAYVYAGNQSLKKVGLHVEKNCCNDFDQSLLDALVIAARLIYRYIALLASVVLFLGGSYYIIKVITPAQDITISILAWITFSGGYISNFYFGYINGILQGRGDISDSNKIIVFTKSVFIFFGLCSVVMGFGVLGLGLASLVASILGRILAYHVLYSKYQPFVYDGTGEVTTKARELIKILWHNASRLGAVQLGAFFILRGNILIASSFIGLAAAASYAMTITVLMTLTGVATVIAQLQMPHMSALQAKGDRKNLTRLYGQILLFSWITFVIGLVILIVFGDGLMTLIGSKTQLLPTLSLFALGTIFLLEMNHGIAATYLTTMNHIPFVYAALISGLGIIFLAWNMIVPFGVSGLIMAQGLGQLAFNNWKWPLEVSKNLGCTHIQMIKAYLKNISFL